MNDHPNSYRYWHYKCKNYIYILLLTIQWHKKLFNGVLNENIILLNQQTIKNKKKVNI